MKRRKVRLDLDIPTEGVAHEVWLASLTSWLKGQGITVGLSGDGIAPGATLALIADATSLSGMSPARRQYVAETMGITSSPAPKPLSSYPL